MIRTIGVLIASCLLQGACALMVYDEKNPGEYQEYWGKDENVKRSCLYPFTEQAEQERADHEKPKNKK
jgi:hypothetical protein